MIVVLRHLADVFVTNRPVIFSFFSGIFLELLLSSTGNSANMQIELVLLLALSVWLSFVEILHRYTAAVRKRDPDWADALEEYIAAITTILVFMITSYTLQILNDARRGNRLSAAELIIYPAILLLAIITQNIITRQAIANKDLMRRSLQSYVDPGA